MKKAIVLLEGIGALLQSKPHWTEKKPKEGFDDYEARTWRERCHYVSDGTVYIPAEMFKNSICEAASYLGEKIKGQGQKTWTQKFRSGIRVPEPLMLDIKKDDVQELKQFCDSQGRRGGKNSKVLKSFPTIPRWGGEVEFWILEGSITEEVFIHHLRQAGNFIGIGKQRPSNGGDFGRFQVIEYQWIQDAVV